MVSSWGGTGSRLQQHAGSMMSDAHGSKGMFGRYQPARIYEKYRNYVLEAIRRAATLDFPMRAQIMCKHGKLRSGMGPRGAIVNYYAEELVLILLLLYFHCRCWRAISTFSTLRRSWRSRRISLNAS